MQTQNKQKGFTLIEIAIVLVIIGLLLGGVLKGQELIKSAKVKAAAGDVNAYSVALIGYQDRYGDLFTSTNVAAATDTVAAKSAAILAELTSKGLVSSKNKHSLGGDILIIRTGTTGATNLAQNTSTTPQTFTWGLCYTGVSSVDDKQGIIRAIDGNSVDFTDTNAATNPYISGRARIVGSDYTAVADTTAAETETNATICFEI